MSANNLFVQQKLLRAQSACDLAVAQIRNCRALADLPRLLHVPCESFVRPLVRRELREVQQAAEKRSSELLRPELEKLKAAAGADLEAQVQRLRQLQQFLRGDLARVFHDVDRAIAETSRAKKAGGAPAP